MKPVFTVFILLCLAARRNRHSTITEQGIALQVWGNMDSSDLRYAVPDIAKVAGKKPVCSGIHCY